MLHANLYGTYRTRTFSDVFSTFEEFDEFYKDCGIPHKIDTSIETLYYLLLARYANSHIASSDENRFALSVMSTIFQYGPAWQIQLSVQDKLGEQTLEQLREGSKKVYNQAYNPSTEPTTSTLDELTTINEQNTSNAKKGWLELYSDLNNLLKTDITARFLDKFKDLFTKFSPELPLLYVNEVDEEEEEDE